jgi:pseudomonalisin
MALTPALLAQHRLARLFAVIVSLLFCSFPGCAQSTSAADALFPQPKDRITGAVDDGQRVTLTGNRFPLATDQNDIGAVAPDYPMDRMILTLLPDSDQQDALDQLLEAQQNPESSYYHQWLTPEQFAERFGASENDAAQVTAWLQGHGMQVEEVGAGHLSIIFSATAAQVQAAFHTPIHVYDVNGEIHHANATDPEIPAALAEVVGGVVSLHDFRKQPMHSVGRSVSPEFTTAGVHYLAPGDFATIYDLGPAYGQSINGAGEAVAIVARSNIKLSDVQTFRNSFGLPANNPQIIVNGANPGIWSWDEETEADLDVEWAGAVAKNATIDFVVSQSTNTTDGIDLSAQYIVNHNLAPVMSTSFGSCEASLGSSGNAFYNSLWQQAAAEGITVFVSSGDSGAAGCDSASESRAVDGLAVNGLCSTPYDICVGGTEFLDSNATLYWSANNIAGSESSALSYIPEAVWNQSANVSGGSGLWAGGGGASGIYDKPAWQTGAGVAADGRRDVPDVSLAAGSHDGYLIYQEGGLYAVGGTSASTPSFAGLMAMVAQNANARLGNANAAFYPLAAKQAAGGAAVFHDITVGNNSVPGLTGFNAASGYDRASGLGSVDGSVMVNHWSDAKAVPSLQITPSSSSIEVEAGASNSLTVNLTTGGGFQSPVALTITGLPRGVSATFTPATLASPGTGSSKLNLNATISSGVGTYTATLWATGGGITQQQTITVTISGRHTLTGPLRR